MCVDSHAHLEGASPAYAGLCGDHRQQRTPAPVAPPAMSADPRSIGAANGHRARSSRTKRFRRFTTTKSLRALWKPDQGQAAPHEPAAGTISLSRTIDQGEISLSPRRAGQPGRLIGTPSTGVSAPASINGRLRSPPTPRSAKRVRHGRRPRGPKPQERRGLLPKRLRRAGQTGRLVGTP